MGNPLAGDDDPDTLHIKISEEDDCGVETVAYDNGSDQAIGAGRIVIHTKKNKVSRKVSK